MVVPHELAFTDPDVLLNVAPFDAPDTEYVTYSDPELPLPVTVNQSAPVEPDVQA